MPSDLGFAEVAVKRESALSASTYIFTVWVDGQKVGTLANGGSLVVRAVPGRHSMEIRPPRLAGLPSSDAFSFERTLRNTYSSVTEERQTFAEEVTLNVVQHTKSEIVFSWKEIRQKGTVRIAGADFEAQIPYEAVVGLTFDQQQIDVL